MALGALGWDASTAMIYYAAHMATGEIELIDLAREGIVVWEDYPSDMADVGSPEERERVRALRAREATDNRTYKERMLDMERSEICNELEECGGDVRATALRLKIPERTLWGKTQRLEIDPATYRPGRYEGTAEALADCTSLDELLGLMLANDERLGDWTSLPTFGGEDPASTHEVWSWDATRMIMGTCEDDIQIVSREE